MRTRLIAVGSLATMLVTAAPLIVRAQTNTTPAPGTPVPPARQARQRRERHPELLRAMRALQRAKGALMSANRDFGGHRAKAAELTEAAIKEIQAAIQSDKG